MSTRKGLAYMIAGVETGTMEEALAVIGAIFPLFADPDKGINVLADPTLAVIFCEDMGFVWCKNFNGSVGVARPWKLDDKVTTYHHLSATAITDARPFAWALTLAVLKAWFDTAGGGSYDTADAPPT